ncbi:MAG TPA: hypothetical protein DCF62_10150 [Porticoccaceae bacterium]|nr:hypothetical protein [Porticoccaceae bacterium]HCO58828.1 hypothetical protein [Porticoccaceae bacterium]
MTINAISRLIRIINEAASAPDFATQAQRIVDGISQSLAVDVCSLYRQDQAGDLVLVASHGLSSAHPIKIPGGKGLVGRVISTGEVINIINPEQEPEYFYVPDSDEFLFHSFCGVPLIQHARAIGVLVAQRKQARLISADDEAVLISLASHLALVFSNLPVPRGAAQQFVFKGVSGARGLAIGRATLRQSETLVAVHPQTSHDLEADKVAWAALRADTLSELAKEREVLRQNLGESMAAVLDAYQQFLLDPSFVSQVETHLAEGSALPWAIKQAVTHFSDLFLAIEDPYLQARHEDIVHLGDKLYQVWRRHQDQHEQKPAGEQPDVQTPFVLCGDSIAVSDIANLPTKQLMGIVCWGGAALSHVAVFANALGIPAVMGVGDLAVEDGDMLIVDGDQGEVYLKPPRSVLREYRTLIDERQAADRLADDLCHLPAHTTNGQMITVMANSGLQADIQPGLNNGADGIGLYRTELPFMVNSHLPSEDEQVRIYRQVIEAYDGKPVCFRLLDIGGDKPLSYLPVMNEPNPALGLRGIRFLLDNEQILKTQLRAILRAAQGAANVQLLVPMVTNTAELLIVSRLLDEEVERLAGEGEPARRPDFGVMVEVPGVVALLPLWRQHIDFISIGSNDLSQYLLAVDRNNPRVARTYDALHPGVLHEIHRIVTTAAQCRLPLSLCGELASNPLAVLLLLGMGVRRFSMSAARIPSIKWLVQRVATDELEQLLNQALALDDAGAIRQLGEQFLTRISGDSATGRVR